MILRFLSLCLFVSTLFGCSRDQSGEVSGASDAVDSVGSDFELRQEVVSRGRDAAKALKENLFNAQLKSTIESGEAASALPTCHTTALPITEGTARLFEGVNLHRTSLKLRNRSNQPDSLDLQVLTTFQAQHDTGLEVSTEIVEQTENGARYYEPIFIKKICLNCHGSREEMDPDVVKNLALLYPEDEAYGYKEGDFRGVIRADIEHRRPLDEGAL